MKQFDIGQTVQILANLGVIAGIIFLAFEVRQNNDFMRADAEHRIFEHRTNFRRAMYQDASMAELVVKNGMGEELSVAERARLRALFDVLYAGMSWEFRQYEAGRASDYPMSAVREVIEANDLSKSVWIDFLDGLEESHPTFLRFLEDNGLTQFNE